MTQFSTNFNETIPFSDLNAQIALAANTALTYTVPGDASMQYRCLFSYAYNTNVWVGYNVTAALPAAGAVTSTANIELRPEARYVRGGDVLSFISDSIVGNAGLSLLRVAG